LLRAGHLKESAKATVRRHVTPSTQHGDIGTVVVVSIPVAMMTLAAQSAAS